MPRRIALALAGAVALAIFGCSGSTGGSAPQPAEHSLSGLAAQHLIVLPTYSVRVDPSLAWASSVGRTVDIQRMLDADIAAALDDRGVKSMWIFPDQLEQSYRRNSTYAADPYHLAEEPLRSPSIASDLRLPEPFASQIRTLVALHDDVRYVLAPVELKLEPAGPANGKGVLRVVLIDARASNVRWSGDITSDTASAFGPAITASIGARLASVVAP